MVGQMLHEMHSKLKSSLLTFMNAYPSYIEFNFEYVDKITSLCGNLSYHLFILCQFKVELIFKAAKSVSSIISLSALRF